MFGINAEHSTVIVQAEIHPRQCPSDVIRVSVGCSPESVEDFFLDFSVSSPKIQSGHPQVVLFGRPPRVPFENSTGVSYGVPSVSVRNLPYFLKTIQELLKLE